MCKQFDFVFKEICPPHLVSVLEEMRSYTSMLYRLKSGTSRGRTVAFQCVI
jgi:hypothetical protein